MIRRALLLLAIGFLVLTSHSYAQDKAECDDKLNHTFHFWMPGNDPTPPPSNFSNVVTMIHVNHVVRLSQICKWDLSNFLFENGCNDKVCDKGSYVTAFFHRGSYTIFYLEGYTKDTPNLVMVFDEKNLYRERQFLRGYYYRFVKLESIADSNGFVTEIPVIERIP